VWFILYGTKQSVGTYCAGTQFIVFRDNSVPAPSLFKLSDIPPLQPYVLSYFFKHALGLTAGVNFSMPLSTVAADAGFLSDKLPCS
jgi:hypothetical protein